MTGPAVGTDDAAPTGTERDGGRDGAAASDVSHALKSPLQTIVGVADLLHEGAYGALTGEQRSAVARLIRRGRDLQDRLDTVEALLHLDLGGAAGPDTGPPAEPAAVAETATRRLRERAVEAGVDLAADVPAGHPPLRVGQSTLLRLFEIAIRFVLDGTGEGAVLLLRAWPPEAEFGRLGVVTDGVSSRRRGATLELYAIRRILQALGGSTWGGDEGPGLRFRLPLADSAEGGRRGAG